MTVSIESRTSQDGEARINGLLAQRYPAKAARLARGAGQYERAAQLFENAILMADEQAYGVLAHDFPDLLFTKDPQAIEDNEEVLAEAAGYLWDAARYSAERATLLPDDSRGQEWERANKYAGRSQALYESINRMSEVQLLDDLCRKIEQEEHPGWDSDSEIAVL